MSDELLNIKLTESEVNLVMNALTFLACEVDKDGDGASGALELHDDLMEQVARNDDPEWEGRTFTIAEDDMIQRGMDAREQAKMHSRAAARRNFNLKVKDNRLSKTQTHDVWDANDPRNW